MTKSQDLRDKAAKLLEEADALDALQSDFADLPKVKVACGPCLGRGGYNRSHDKMDFEECEACEGKGYGLMLKYTGRIEQRFYRLVQPDTTGWGHY